MMSYLEKFQFIKIIEEMHKITLIEEDTYENTEKQDEHIEKVFEDTKHMMDKE